MTKYVVVTGGVVSGIGKGIVTASIARLLPSNGKIVTVKCDGYLNVDPGTMSPVEHGEVFVLEDGAEVDMDFGHYERFLGITCKADWSMTSGKVFDRLIAKERRGAFLGQTIQIYPHVIQEIKQWWKALADAEQADIVTIEVGGTVGDIENSWFIEAARQLRKDVGDSNVVYVHVTYVPVLDSVGEPKTKPAQRDVALLHEKGIRPDVIVVRSRHALPDRLREKLALFCDVTASQVVSAPDVPVVYEIPLFFRDQHLYQLVRERLSLHGVSELANWESLVQRMISPAQHIVVGICGKYNQLHDSYASIIEALRHAGAYHDVGIVLRWVDTEVIEKEGTGCLVGIAGFVVPGGFGGRGAEGKIRVIQYARENAIPFLGICYGLQLAVVEFARNVCGLSRANTTEVDADTEFPVIDILPSQQGVVTKGGTMRLGVCKADLLPGSLVQSLYDQTYACERHRHRYEVNPVFHEILKNNGLVFSGTSEGGRLVEFIELPDNKFFVASQAHNELTSRLEISNPLFRGFVGALCADSDKCDSGKNKSNAKPLGQVHPLPQHSS